MGTNRFVPLGIAFLATPIAMASVWTIGATFAALAAGATTSQTTQHSTMAKPTCVRHVTMISNPCGTTIYIEDSLSGSNAISCTMATGRYTLGLLARGHHPNAQRILVPDAPYQSMTNLVPEP
jgi:tetrahydromethanopterin S-methyltransferase subunit D